MIPRACRADSLLRKREHANDHHEGPHNIFYKDWGRVSPSYSATAGHSPRTRGKIRCFFRVATAIAHRSRPSRSRTFHQTWNGNDMDTYADDLAALIETLDLQNAIHVGHSTGGGEVARYIGRHGTKRVAKAVLVGAVPP